MLLVKAEPPMNKNIKKYDVMFVLKSTIFLTTLFPGQFRLVYNVSKIGLFLCIFDNNILPDM